MRSRFAGRGSIILVAVLAGAHGPQSGSEMISAALAAVKPRRLKSCRFYLDFIFFKYASPKV